jgi:hypothetical protein
VWFAVSSKGVSIVEADHPHGVYKFWSYREVANWGNTKQNFHLVAGNLQKPEKRSFTSAYSAHVRGHTTPPLPLLRFRSFRFARVARRHMWRCNEADSCSHATHSRSASRFVICRFLQCTLASPAGPATPTSREYALPRSEGFPFLWHCFVWCIVDAACCGHVPLMRATIRPLFVFFDSRCVAFSKSSLLTSAAPRCCRFAAVFFFALVVPSATSPSPRWAISRNFWRA